MKSAGKFLLSSIILFNADILLAMDPVLPTVIGKGAKALGEELSVFGKRVTPSNAPVVATAVAYSPVESNVFSSSIATISGQGAVATAAAAVDETGEENSTAQLLEKEIYDNIYLSCLAKVATISVSEGARTAGALGFSQEAKEWAAAEEKAIRDVDKRKKELTKATQERTIAYKEMESADASFHGRDYVPKVNTDFKVKECAEQLAEARVATAEATLFAIRVKDAAQNSGAKADLIEALEEEKKALEVLEEARATIENRLFSKLASVDEVQGVNFCALSASVSAILKTGSNVAPMMTKAECERLQTEARTKAIEATESARRARTEAQQAHENAEAAYAEKRKCWLQSSKDAKREEAEAFEKSVIKKRAEANLWENVSATSMRASGYWEKALESVTRGDGEKANFWIMKARVTESVTEVKVLGATPCGDSWSEKRNRADEIMTMNRNKVWPFASEAMRAFIEHPSEARMRNASAFVSAFVSASAYASVSASAYVYAYTSVYASGSGSASAYESTSAYESASTAAAASASASAYASASASAYASASAAVSASAYVYVSAYAYAYASISMVSKIFAESSSDAADSAKIFEAVDTSRTILLGQLKDHPDYFSDAQKQNITWSVQSERETAAFAHAVIAFKKNQEASTARSIQPSSEEAIREQNLLIEREKFAEVKVLAAKPYGDSWSDNGDRANAIMKMTREKFGSPISPAMKEFIAHPNEATLRATGKSSIIAMTADEAEEAVETAEIFAKIAADAAELGRKNSINAALQENVNWSETITHEVVEFARAVATFKAAQQP